jgi:biopolymer transport protein ExbB
MNQKHTPYTLTIVLLATSAIALAQPADDTPTVAETPAVSNEEPADEAAGTAETSDKTVETTDTEKADAADDASNETDDSVMSPETRPWQEVLGEMFSGGAIGLLLDGGPFMWPILIMGIIATGVIIERYRSLKMLSTDTDSLRSEVAALLRADRPEEALKKCEAEQGPVPAVLAAGVRKFYVLRRLNYDAGRIEEQVVKAMDDYSVHIVAALERHLPVLATVSSAAPMLGFLGTVQGMIIAFRDIVEKMGETNIVEAAAAGIQTALLTTCFGLIIGIPAYVAYNYFTSVINRYVLEVEETATELIETVTLHMALENNDTDDATAQTK